MANNIFTGLVSSDWGTSGNWSLGSVPTASDGHIVVFNASSPNCTVNSTARFANNIDFTGYTNTITMSNELTVSGNVTLSSGMGINGSGRLTISLSSTLTSNGRTWPNALRLSAQTTLLGDISINGLFTVSTNMIINGNYSINANGGATISGNFSQGAGTNITLNILGGTWSGSGQLGVNTNIGGTVAVSGSVTFGNSKTLTKLSGASVTTTGSTLTINSGATLDVDGIMWYNVSIVSTTIIATITLNSNLNIYGLFYTYITAAINGPGEINAYGGMNMAYYFIYGTAVLNMKGGTFITNTGPNQAVGLNIKIDGNITIDNFSFGGNNGTGKKLEWISGTVTSTGTLTLVNSVNLTLKTGSNIVWTGVSTGGYAPVMTLEDDLYISGSLSGSYVPSFSGSSYSIITWGGVNYTVAGYGITRSANPAKIVFKSGSVWQGVGYVNLDIVFDGNVTVSGTVNTGGGNTIVQNPGATVTTTGSTLSISRATSCTINTPTVTWNNFSISIATLNLLSDLIVGETYTKGGANNLTINGSYSTICQGSIVNNLSIIKGTGTPSIKVYTAAGSYAWTSSGSFVGGIVLDIDPIGTITLSGVLQFTGTLTRNTTNGGTFDAGTSTLRINGNSTINTNGSTATSPTSASTTGINWYNFTVQPGILATLSSNLCVRGTLTLSQAIISGSDIYVNGDLTAATATSYTSTNTTLILQGTGTWSGNFPLGFNITFASTCNITVSGTVNHYGIGGKTIYAAPGATVNTTGSTLRLLGSGTNLHIINTASVVWENVILFSYNPSTFKLESDLNVGGDLITSYWTGAGPIIYMNGAGYNININGALTVGSALYSGTLDAGPTLKLLTKVGTFTWSGSPLIQLPVIINPTGTLNVSGTVTYGGNLNTSVLTYNNSNGGSVGTTGSTLYLSSSCTLNTNGISWNNVLLANSTVNYALTSDFITKNLTSGGGIQTFNTNNGSIVKVLNGTLTVGQNNGIEGNSTIVVEGTSSWISATSANCQLRINLILRPNGGVITVGNNGFPLSFNTKTITYDGSGGGSASATGSTLNLNTSTILNTAGITWGTVNILNGTHTLNSLLTANTIGFGTVNNTVIFAGTAGWTVDTFTISVTGGARLIQLKQGITYTITTSATMIAQSSIIKLRFESAQTSGSKPLFNIQPGASQNISHVYPYRIDSSGGQTVYSANATIDVATVNWTNVAPSRGNFLLLFY